MTTIPTSRRDLRRMRTAGFFEDGPRFRPEVQGLRAIAVLAVVLFHLAPTRLPGGFVGVDIFFVISGFLITGHLLRDAQKYGKPSLLAFWLRRVRRLLPAAFLVLATTLVSVLLVVPTALWRQFLTEIGASALYVQNWLLAVSSVDYFAEDQGASPVQHYWSLSTEEQFYLVWPLLVTALVVLTHHRAARHRRATIAPGIAVVLVGSLIYSAIVANETYGYFSTFTHAWEFAAGGLLSIYAARIMRAFERAPILGAFVAWTGYLLIVWSFLFYSSGTPFPGVAAIVPVVGAIAVIAAGTTKRRFGPDKLVELRPVQWMGNISYSLYLWHWPPIVLLPFITGRPLTTTTKVIILMGAVVAAAITKRWVEDRYRGVSGGVNRSRLMTTAGLLLSTALIVSACAVPLGVLSHNDQMAREQLLSQESGECLGAKATTNARCSPDFKINPDFGPAFAKSDTISSWVAGHVPDPQLDIDRCPIIDGEVRECVLGDLEGARTIAVVGDSHVRHYLPAILPLASERGWRVELLWRESCRPVLPLFDSPVAAEAKDGCTNWKNQVVSTVADDDSIDVVLTSGATRFYTQLMSSDELKTVADAFRKTWSVWTDAGKRVVVLTDTPLAPTVVTDCMAASRAKSDPCAQPRSVVRAADPIDLAFKSGAVPGTQLIDTTRAQCDEDTCHFAVGGLITHRDEGHLTASYAESLAELIGTELSDTETPSRTK